MNRGLSFVSVDWGRFGVVVLVSVLVSIEATLSLSGGPGKVPEVYLTLGLSRDGMAAGKFWQLISYALLHGGWLHLLPNAVALVWLAPQVHRILGGKALGFNLAGGVLAGGLAHLALADPGELLIGVSGGVSAVLLLLTSLAPESKVRFLRISAGNLGKGILIASAVLTALSPRFGLLPEAWDGERGEGVFKIAHACHLGGGLFGWAMGRWVLRPRADLKKLRAARARREGSP